MAKTTKTSATLGLFVREEHDGDYYHVRAFPVWVGRTPDELRDLDAGRPVRDVARETLRSASSRYDAGLYFDGLQVNSQGHERDGADRKLYAWDVDYRDVYSVDRQTAERMAKTLQTIERKLDKMTDDYGRPATFGAYLLRVARAVGATTIVLAKQPGAGFQDETRHLSLSDGQMYVDSRISKWVDQGARATVQGVA